MHTYILTEGWVRVKRERERDSQAMGHTRLAKVYYAIIIHLKLV